MLIIDDLERKATEKIASIFKVEPKILKGYAEIHYNQKTKKLTIELNEGEKLYSCKNANLTDFLEILINLEKGSA